MTRSEILRTLYNIRWGITQLCFIPDMIVEEEIGRIDFKELTEKSIEQFIISETFNRTTEFSAVINELIDNPSMLTDDIRKEIEKINALAGDLFNKCSDKRKRAIAFEGCSNLWKIGLMFQNNYRFFIQHYEPLPDTSKVEIKQSDESLPQKKKIGRRRAEFKDCIEKKYKKDEKEIIDKINKLLEGKIGKEVAEVIWAAIQKGYIRKPYYAEFNNEFPGHIDKTSFYNHIRNKESFEVEQSLSLQIIIR